jgi:uncharacterized membrane protein
VSRWNSVAAGAIRLLLPAILTVGWSVDGLDAQSLPAQPPDPGSELTVYVITLGQGDQIWERYGHNALWIHDAARGTDRTYNWGIFDASGPQFIFRFIRGRMRYWMESVDVNPLLTFYRSHNRTIDIQRLALDPAQRAALRDFAEWNAREENKYYWYDYFRDNCSTRLRDALDRALGGALRAATESVTTAHTYRSESLRLMEGMPLTQAGIMLALGPRTDRPITGWEEMFVPMRMRDRLRAVRLIAPDGTRIPIVSDERRVFVANRPPEVQQAPPLARRYVVLGVIAAGIVAGLATLAHGAWRAPFGIVSAVWALLIGVAGLLLLFLWLGTHHVFAARNENLFQVVPFAVFLAIVAPLAVYRPHWRRYAWWLGAAVLATSLLGLALKAIPGFEQDNLAIVAIVLPAHVTLAWALRRLGRGARARGAVVS